MKSELDQIQKHKAVHQDWKDSDDLSLAALPHQDVPGSISEFEKSQSQGK